MKVACKWGGVVIVSLASMVGCAGSDGSESEGVQGFELPAASSQAASDTVEQPFLVKEKEFSVTPSPKKLSAGTVRFMVLNQGEEFHEFLVVRTDLSIANLPTNPDGSFDEEGAGVDVLDEIEHIDPGTMGTLTLTLESGHYVLLGNRVEIDDGEVESHFAMGMVTEINVR